MFMYGSGSSTTITALQTNEILTLLFLIRERYAMPCCALLWHSISFLIFYVVVDS